MRVDELDPEREMRVAAVPRLHDRRIGELPVDLRDSCVRPVVEAAIRRDRTVDAVDEAHVVPGEAAEPAEVEVEGVEEAGSCSRGDPVHLDRETASLELGHERPQELMPTARRRRRELVEERHIRRSSPREADAVDLRRDLARNRAGSTARPCDHAAPCHAEAVAPSAASTSNWRISFAYRAHVRWRSTVSRPCKPEAGRERADRRARP